MTLTMTFPLYQCTLSDIVWVFVSINFCIGSNGSIIAPVLAAIRSVGLALFIMMVSNNEFMLCY